ncbi:hypothetical protein KBA41_12205, partial [Candidatus Ozemobacteraceae bacterium]|nr:hypothetical protein [Candidatus Ozemobacteraceae bacterium]
AVKLVTSLMADAVMEALEGKPFEEVQGVAADAAAMAAAAGAPAAAATVTKVAEEGAEKLVIE